jgi:hypothetical protein
MCSWSLTLLSSELMLELSLGTSFYTRILSAPCCAAFIQWCFFYGLPTIHVQLAYFFKMVGVIASSPFFPAYPRVTIRSPLSPFQWYLRPTSRLGTHEVDHVDEINVAQKSNGVLLCRSIYNLLFYLQPSDGVRWYVELLWLFIWPWLISLILKFLCVHRTWDRCQMHSG